MAPAFLCVNGKSFEQSTSQVVATYKSLLFNGETYINITGGLGVDDWAFSKVFRQGYSIELDEDMHELAVYNQQKLGVTNIQRIYGDSLKWLADSDIHIDLIYADPDRRAAQTKDHSLANSAPDILHHLDLLQSKADKLLVKLSPMADITMTLRQLPGIKDIWIIALEGEVKELLILAEKGYTDTPQVHAVLLNKRGDAQTFSNVYHPMQQVQALSTGDNGWLAEPDASVIKAGLAVAYHQHLGLTPVNAESTLAWSADYLPAYRGRMLRLVKPDALQA